MKLEHISIIYLNNEYIRIGDVDINELFSIESVLEEVTERQHLVSSNIEEEVVGESKAKLLTDAFAGNSEPAPSQDIDTISS